MRASTGKATLSDLYFDWEITLRFELIDRVTEVGEDHLVGIKNVTISEEYLQDHFPGFPVLPGVMMLETLVQAARLLLEELDQPKLPMIIREVRNVRYGNMVRPGETLVVTVHLRKRNEDGSVAFEGTGEVGGQSAVQARFVLIDSDQMETANVAE